MFKKILKFKVVSVASLLSLLLTLSGFFWAYFSLRAAGTGPLIIHFNDIEGITAGSLQTIIFMGILGMAVVIINFAIALELEERDRFLGKIAAAITFVFAVLLFIAFAAIINVN